MTLRALLHLLLHAAVPAFVAWLFYRDRLKSIGFHPLHTAPAIAVYGALVVPRVTRLVGIGLLIHIALDALDCLLMR